MFKKIYKVRTRAWKWIIEMTFWYIAHTSVFFLVVSFSRETLPFDLNNEKKLTKQKWLQTSALQVKTKLKIKGQAQTVRFFPLFRDLFKIQERLT